MFYLPSYSPELSPDEMADATIAQRKKTAETSNLTWTRMRARLLQVPLVAPRHREAAYGAALLAAGLVG